MKYLLFGATLLLFSSCDSDQQKNEGQHLTDTVDIDTNGEHMSAVLEKDGISLVPFRSSEPFGDSKLSLQESNGNSKMDISGQVFQFQVENYELGKQTTMPDTMKLANSGMGQHIHVIVDNQPYTAHYTDTAHRKLNAGKHVLLAFLSRSYHESIKHRDAYVLKEFTVGDDNTAQSFNPDAPQLFYSRPKGSYKADEFRNLLLDFYLVNANLGNEYKVQVTIDGTEFIVTEWVPYIVKGLEPGDHTFRIRLIDGNGRTVDGLFNDSGDRKITLAQ